MDLLGVWVLVQRPHIGVKDDQRKEIFLMGRAGDRVIGGQCTQTHAQCQPA